MSTILHKVMGNLKRFGHILSVIYHTVGEDSKSISGNSDAPSCLGTRLTRRMQWLLFSTSLCTQGIIKTKTFKTY